MTMTNEQLKFVLLNIVSRLEKAVEETDERLEDVPRHATKKYTGNYSIPPFLKPKDNDEWEDVPGKAIALDPITEVIADIKRQTAVLDRTPPEKG